MTNDKRARRVQRALMLMQGSEASDEWAFNEGVRVGVRVGVCAVLRKVQTRYIQRQPRPSARLGDLDISIRDGVRDRCSFVTGSASNDFDHNLIHVR